MGFADTANLVANLSLKGNFGSQLTRYSRQLDTFDAKIDKTQGRAYTAGQQIGTGLRNLGKIGVVAAGTVAGIGIASLKAAGDFEAQLNTINTIARETPQNLAAIGDQVRNIARETGTPLEDLTQGYYDLLSAGIKAADAQNVLAASNRLAIGGLSTTAESVDLLTTAINTYGGDATQAAADADIFAKAIERGKVTAAEIASSFATVGSVAASSGIDLKELGAGYARLTAAGVPAAEAATQMRSAIISLTRTTKPLEALQKATGRNYLSIAGKKGLVVAMEQLRQDAKKAGVPLIDLLGRVEALNFVNLTTGKNLEAYNADLAAMGDAAGTAADQMGERQKGLNYQIGILKANAKDAAITIGSALLPKITPLVQKLNELIQGHQGDISRFADSFAAIFSDSNIASAGTVLTGLFNAAKDAAPALAASARITGEVVTKAVELFNTLPKEIRGLLIAGLAVNKLTGGLVGNIAGGLVSSIVSSFKGNMNVTAGVVTVNGAVAGGGGIGGAAGAAAGGTSKVSRIAGAAGKVVGAVAIVGSALAVLETQQQVSERNTQVSQGIRANLDEMLTKQPSRTDLQNSLGAVEAGIAKIRSNPLYTFVQGEALTNLEAMRETLKAQLSRDGDIAARTGKAQADQAAKTDNLTAAQKRAAADAARRSQTIAEKVRSGAYDTKRSVDANATRVSGAVRATSDRIATAVANQKPPIVNVKVAVSATNVTKQITYGSRTGKTGTGYAGHAPGTGPLP